MAEPFFLFVFVCLNHVIVLIQIIRNLVQQPLRIIPSQTGMYAVGALE